jgi:hypothetical protein
MMAADCAERLRRAVFADGAGDVVAKAERDRDPDGERGAVPAIVGGARSLPRERDPAGDDEERAGGERPAERFAEGDDRKERREERRHPEEDPGARGARRPHRVDDEELRDAGDKRADHDERPEFARVEPDLRRDGGRHDRNEREDGDRGGARVDIPDALERAAHRHVQSAEEESRGTGEEDAGQRARAAGARPSASGEMRSAAGTAAIVAGRRGGSRWRARHDDARLTA